MNTRKLSDKQEKRLARNIGGRQVIGSGSTPFLKGDVITSDLFIEAKTKAVESKSISVKKAWLEKAQEQAYSMRKKDYALAISFGDGKDYYVLEDSLMEDLYKSTDTPLTTLLMGRGAVVPATDITVTWRERKLNETRGTLKLEGAEAGDPIKSSRSTLSNLCQIIEKVTQVSGTAQALNPKGIGKSFEAEINDRLIETKRDLEWYFLNGTKAAGSETVPRQMNGLVNLVNADNVVDATEGLTEILMLDAMQKMWDHGSQGEYFTFVNAGTKRIINSLIKADGNIRINTEQGLNQVLGITVQKIESDFGTLNLVLDRHMDANTMLILDLDQVEIAELRGTFFEMLPKNGDYFKGCILLIHFLPPQRVLSQMISLSLIVLSLLSIRELDQHKR